MRDLHEVMAEIIGYHDGSRDKRADTRIVESEYRRFYLRGLIRGRLAQDDAGEAGLEPPHWVNQPSYDDKQG